MAQIIVKPKPKPKVIVAIDSSIPSQENTITLEDWDTFLHSLWLDKMKTNPAFYDDMKVNHATGRCPCRCTASPFLTEVHTHR